MKTFVSAITLGVLFCLQPLSAEDLTPPQITSLSVSTNSVDVSSSSVTVQVTVNITDDESGFNYGWIDLYNSYDNYVFHFPLNIGDVLPGGTAQDGTYVVDVEIPQYVGTGTWTLRSFLVDQADRHSQYGGGNTPFPVPANAEIEVTNGGQEDIEAPELVSMSITPDFVDVSSQDATVTVTLNFTDSPSGLRYGYADLLYPNGSYSDIYTYLSDTEITGTPQDGSYTFEMTIPQGSVAGSWELAVQVTDIVGNFGSFSGFPGSSITVVNQVAVTGDLSDACDATQYAWSTSGDSEWFFQTETTFDGIDAARSGALGDDQISEMSMTLQGPGTLSFRWKVDSEDGEDTLSVEVPGGPSAGPISGNVDWTEVTLEIPEGEQTVVWTYSKNFNIGFNEDAGWVDRVHFTTDVDSEQPVLQYILITPNPVTLFGGDQEVTVTFELSDDLHGVAGATVYIYDAFSTQYQSIPCDSQNRISGDDNFGTYQVSFTAYQEDFIPDENYEPGTWRVDVEIEELVTSDYRTYGQGADPYPNPGAELFILSLQGSQDNQGPELISLNSVTPGVVDVTSADGSITVDFDVTDTVSGFSYGFIYLFTEEDQNVVSYYFDASEGSDTNFSIEVPVYRHAPPGLWKIGMSLYDNQGNETFIYHGFPGPASDLFTVVNTGAVDSTAPTLQSISITPGSVNTGSSSANLDIDLELADDLSGIDYIFIDVFNPAGTKIDSLFRYIDGGRSLDGDFTTSLTLPQGSELGLWRVEVYVRDMLGNSRRYGPGETDSSFPVSGAETFVNGTAPVSTYSGFTNTYLLVGNDAQMGSNPDSDWANNALELLLGLNPTIPGVPDPSIYLVARTGNEIHLDFKVAPSLTATPNGDFLDISDGGGGSPLRVTGETAGNPAGPWTDVQPQSLGGGFYRVIMEITPGGKGFLRLKFIDP